MGTLTGLLVRHFLTALAGYLAARGLIDQGAADSIVAAGLALAGVAWSFVQKKQSGAL